MQHYYITTPIFYINGEPHIGHIYTMIISDIITRILKLQGNNVIHISGTDEHGQKIIDATKHYKMHIEKFTDKMSSSFKEMINTFKISNNYFIRTTNTTHKKKVQQIWQTLESKGYIYLGKYSGWYSKDDESYYNQEELTKEGTTPTGSKVEWLEEDSYFFTLSKFKEKLLEHYNTNPLFIFPQIKRKEIIKFIENGLQDLSISRTKCNWGIDVPNNNKHKIYVWFDALISYISALHNTNIKESILEQHWHNSIHCIGKDIIKFHTIYWPALLIALDIKPPKTILIHGWWKKNNQKISKSKNNTVSPSTILKKYSVDQIRYFLVRNIKFGNDGNFKYKNLDISNKELLNKIGNFHYRIMKFVEKYYTSKIPLIKKSIEDLYKNELSNLTKIKNKNNEYIKIFAIDKILYNILYIAENMNRHIELNQPWDIYKTNIEKTNEIVYIALENLRYIGIMLQSFIPQSAEQILNQLNIHAEHRTFIHLSYKFALKPGTNINKHIKLLFS